MVHLYYSRKLLYLIHQMWLLGRECSPYELYPECNTTYPNLTRNLIRLHECGLVEKRNSGRNVFYKLTDSGFAIGRLANNLRDDVK